MRHQLRLEAKGQSPARAREFTRRVLSGDPPEIREAALLLVSELVTNAVEHARSGVLLVLERDGRRLRVEVHDAGGPLPGRSEASGPRDEHGRGLHLVEALAQDWGVEPGRPGKAVWFELALG